MKRKKNSKVVMDAVSLPQYVLESSATVIFTVVGWSLAGHCYSDGGTVGACGDDCTPVEKIDDSESVSEDIE